MQRFRRVAGALAVLCLGLHVPARAQSDKDDVDKIGDRNVAHKSIISTDREIAIGRQYADQIDKTAKLVKDPVVNEYVNRIAQNVARNSDLKVPLTVKVIDAPDINAFALPGGFLYVNSGLIKAADNESELAGVMAHEIAHVAARHWASQMTKATLLQYATIPLIFVPMSYPVYVGVSSALSYGVPLTFLKFSRNDEAEADHLGLQYMYKAGYDPNAFAAFFGKVLDEERRQPGTVNELFADHPPTPDRIIKAEEEIKNLPPREQYLLSTSEFDDVKARVNTVLASMKRNQKPSPGMERQKPPDQTSTQKPPDQTSNQTPSDDQGADKPPVLQRKD
jgi:beta-barrel assembly-enhancing protease